jgi:two-component system, NarL family, nitrate/nitrite response regulator NarL
MSVAQNLIRILLIDDHATIRTGLAMLLESQSAMKVVGEVGGCSEGIEIARREQPDIILLDLDLGNESGIDCISEFVEVAPKARIIILTGLRDREMHLRAVRLGVMGLVMKDQAAHHLIKAIQKVCEGEVWLDRSMMADVLTRISREDQPKKADPEAKKISTLTERERQIISLIGEGNRNKQIALRLFVSEATVRHYLTTIYDKLGVSDRLELAIYSYRHGLAKLPVADSNLRGDD